MSAKYTPGGADDPAVLENDLKSRKLAAVAKEYAGASRQGDIARRDEAFKYVCRVFERFINARSLRYYHPGRGKYLFSEELRAVGVETVFYCLENYAKKGGDSIFSRSTVFKKIDSEMLRCVEAQRVVRLPSQICADARKLAKATAEEAEGLRRKIAEEHSEEHLERVESLGGSWAYMPAVEVAADAMGFSESYFCEDNSGALAGAVDRLGKRDSGIVRRYFGIGCEPETLREIGRRRGCSAEAIRQRLDAALKKMWYDLKRRNLTAVDLLR